MDILTHDHKPQEKRAVGEPTGFHNVAHGTSSTIVFRMTFAGPTASMFAWTTTTDGRSYTR